jgi:hypothetical protein
MHLVKAQWQFITAFVTNYKCNCYSMWRNKEFKWKGYTSTTISNSSLTHSLTIEDYFFSWFPLSLLQVKNFLVTFNAYFTSVHVFSALNCILQLILNWEIKHPMIFPLNSFQSNIFSTTHDTTRKSKLNQISDI